MALGLTGENAMAGVVAFFAPGVPQPQGSHRAFVVKGRAIITDANAKGRPWRDTVALAAREARGGQEPFTDAVRVEATFRMPRPKSVKRYWPTVRPDLDKLTRLLLDALTIAGVVGDDAQVTTLSVGKRYADEPGGSGVDVTVSPDFDF